MIAAARPGIRENVGCTTVYTDCSTVTDAFNRPDYGDNTLGFADTGQRWSNVPGNAWGGLTTSIITDGYWTTQGTNPNKAQAKVITIDHYRAMRTAINVGGNNQDVTFTFSTADDDYTGCVVRANADTSCGYEIGFSHYGNGTVSKYVDGVGGSPIATWSATSLNTSHTARVRVWRNSLKVWRDGTLVADITIDPDDAGGHCETGWTYFAIGENHGGSGGSAPTQQTVYTNTWVDNLNVIPPAVNLLTTNQWGLEAGTTTGWAAEAAPDFAPGIYTSLSAATDFAFSGTHSLKTTPLAGSVMQSWGSPTGTAGFPVTPGMPYNISARVRTNDNTITLRASMRWYNAAGALLSTTNGGYGATTSGVWLDFSWPNSGGSPNQTAPANAAFGSVLFLSSTLNFSNIWLDEIGVYQTAVTTPIFLAP